VNQPCRIQRWFWISAVGYSANSEPALSDTALSLNQRCIRHHSLLQRRNYEIKTYLWKLISALSDTALIPNQRCIIQRWFRISVVGHIADSESALFDTALIHEYSAGSTFKFQKLCLVPKNIIIIIFSIICVKGHLNRKNKNKNPYLSSNKIQISTVSYSADTHTNRNTLRIRNRIKKYFTVWIRGPYGVDYWKRPEVDNLVLLYL
jgi:hypothetical protein